jgi:hypothetical protein
MIELLHHQDMETLEALSIYHNQERHKFVELSSRILAWILIGVKEKLLSKVEGVCGYKVQE